MKVENVATENCLEIKERHFFQETMCVPAVISNEKISGASEPLPTASLLQDAPSSAMSEVTFPFTSSSPDLTAVPQSVHNCGPSTAYSPNVIHTKVLIQNKSFEDPPDDPTETPAVKVASLSGPSSPAFSKPDSPTSPLNLDLSRNLYTCNFNPCQVSVPHPTYGRALTPIAGSTGHPPLHSVPVILPVAAPSDRSPPPDPATRNLGQALAPECTGIEMACIPTIKKLPQAPEETISNIVQDPDLELSIAGLFSETLSQYPDSVGPSAVPNPQTTLDRTENAGITPDQADIESAFTSPSSSYYQSPALETESVLVQEPPNQDLPSCSSLSAAKLGSLLVPSQLYQIDPPSPNVQNGGVSCPECGSIPVVDSGLGQQFTCVPLFQSSPAITIETESSVVLSASAALSPPPPPAITSSSLPASILLLDPFSVPHQFSKGGSSSGHASSLSPSSRATQSPPKQTLFSPCVDVFEPEPLSWEYGEEEQVEAEENDDDDEDVGADESQYRQRRLTGDSGIEVCRCRVDDEGEECNRRGVHGEMDKNRSENPYLHDSVDCPARSQRTREEEHTTSPPTSEGSDKAVMVTEVV